MNLLVKNRGNTVAVETAKSCKDRKMATRNNTRDRFSERKLAERVRGRRSSGKTASFSGVKLIRRFNVEQERNDRLVTMHTSIARGDFGAKSSPFPGFLRPVGL